ncbi:MAG: hypothetical protein ACTSU5_03400 [Promethearchaeota archaeon]
MFPLTGTIVVSFKLDLDGYVPVGNLTIEAEVKVDSVQGPLDPDEDYPLEYTVRPNRTCTLEILLDVDPQNSLPETHTNNNDVELTVAVYSEFEYYVYVYRYLVVFPLLGAVYPLYAALKEKV